MNSIEKHLIDSVKNALMSLYSQEVPDSMIQVQSTKKEFEGDNTVVVFPLLRMSKKGPEQTADEIGKHLLEHDQLVEGYNVVKGFLNLNISDSYFINQFQEASKNEDFGKANPNGKTVMVEYSSPNTNKPLHLGHLRNNFLGHSVSLILEANGNKVIKTQIINDRGIHICKSMVAWQKFGNGETPETNGLKGDKLVGKYYVMFDQEYKKQIAALVEQGKTEDEAKEEASIMIEAREMLKKWEDKEADTYQLWETMNSWVYEGFDATYKAMGVDFDQLYYESNTYIKGKEEVENGLKSGAFYKREDGSVWCDLTSEGLDEKLVLRSDGTAVYMTQDIGTAILRFQDYPGLAYQIYTVGNEQEYHFKVLFLILKKLGFQNATDNFHLSYGMVELPEGKMKSREGTVVDADDLIHEMSSTAQEIAQEQGKLEGLSDDEREKLYHTIGLGALKYFLLKVDPKKNMMFNPSESIDFNGHTGPFIQYGYVRTQAILRKDDGQSMGIAETPKNIEASEKAVIVKIMEYPQVIQEAGEKFDPSGVANYAFELVKTFNAFYQSTPILREEDAVVKAFRVGLSDKVGKVVKSAMSLLGIDMPQRM